MRTDSKPVILLVDNRDSFTFNLAQAFEALGAEVLVCSAPRLSLKEVDSMDPAGIVLGPGPGPPTRATLSIELVRHFAGRRPVLGICLGHQALAEAYGGRTVRSTEPVHGRPVSIEHDGRGLFAGLPRPASMARYNSLTVDPDQIPAELEVSARDAKGAIMGLRHREHALAGVQFHPESIVSQAGDRLLSNFLAWVSTSQSARTVPRITLS